MIKTSQSKLLLAVAFLVAPLCCLAGEQKPNSATFLRALHDARIRSGSPFVLKAHFKVHQWKGKPDGTYLLEWHDPANWHDVTDVAGYHEERGAVEGHTWRKRPLPYTPKPIFDLRGLMELDRFGWASTDLVVLDSEYKDKVKGEEAWCGKFKKAQLTVAEVCIGRESSRLLSVAGWEISNWQQKDKRSYPATFSLKESGFPALTAEIDELSPMTFEGTLHYMPLDGSMEFPYCTGREYVPVGIDSKPTPQYPPSARQSHTQGSVTVELLVDATGAVTRSTVVMTAGKELDEATLAVVPKWRYRPATCDGKPMEEEIQVRTQYSLGP